MGTNEVTIYATSDLHGYPLTDLDIPACDVLLIAGDILPDSVGRQWTRHTPGLAKRIFLDNIVSDCQLVMKRQSIAHIICTLGNHDWIAEEELQDIYAELPPNIHLLMDNEVTIAGLKFWGTPWSNQFMNWAWMNDPEKLQAVYEKIPADVDVILSHQPPLGAGSTFHDIWSGKTGEIGSAQLRDAITRVQPSAVVCGHIHSGFGEYTLNGTNVYNVSYVNEQYRPENQPVHIVMSTK